jgi:hypothetical protein
VPKQKFVSRSREIVVTTEFEQKSRMKGNDDYGTLDMFDRN